MKEQRAFSGSGILMVLLLLLVGAWTVWLCSESRTQPVVNTGSLYS
jgi:hypothetical protein